MKVVICDGCPCLNTDYEKGSWCNLDFYIDSLWFRKTDNRIVKDTPEMRAHQDDFDLKYASFDCGLITIKTKNMLIKPITLDVSKGE